MRENLTTNSNLELERIETLKDFMWTFIYPNICFFGTITNLINIMILMRSEFKNPIHKFMLAYSVSDFFYLFICCFASLIKCGKFCRVDDSFLTQVYGDVFIDYITSVLAIFNIVIEVFLSIQRYLAIKNINCLQKISILHSLFFIFIFSVIFYLPILFTKTIVKKSLNQIDSSLLQKISNINENHTIYTLEITDFGKSVFGKTVVLSLLLIRNVIFLGFILIFSILTWIQFRKYLNKKMKMKNLNNKLPSSDSATSNFTIFI